MKRHHGYPIPMIVVFSVLLLSMVAGCATDARPSGTSVRPTTNASVTSALPSETTGTTATPDLPAQTTTTTTFPPVIIEGLGRETASYFVGGEVNYPPVVGDGSLWVAAGDLAKVLRLDLASGKLQAEIQAGRPVRPCCSVPSLTYGDGLVWVAQGIDRAILVIDPSLDEVVDSISVAGDPYNLVVDGNTLWVTMFEADRVLRIDTDTRQVVATIDDVLKPTAIVVGGGAVWAVEHRRGTLVRIDPATNSIDVKIQLEGVPGHAPGGENAVFAFGSVWVATNNGQTVARIDAATNQQTAVAFPGADTLRVTAGTTGIWIRYEGNEDDGAPPGFSWIDPDTLTVTRYDFPDAWIFVEHEGILWTTALTPRGDRIVRIELGS